MERRDADELEALYDACVHELDTLTRSAEVRTHGVRVRFFGRRATLPDRVRAALTAAERRTEHHSGHLLNIALAYVFQEKKKKNKKKKKKKKK
jgi:undecaprenyl diphosphate synthase